MNEELEPWAWLSLRLSEIEVQQIAQRGAVTGTIASRILEAIADECEEFVRFRHGALFTRRESRRASRTQTGAPVVPRLRRRAG